MAANNLEQSKAIRSKAAAERVRRAEHINKLAEDVGEEYAVSLLAMCADSDANRLDELHSFLRERPHLKGIPYLADETLTLLSHKAGSGMGSAVMIGHEYKAMIKSLTLESDGPLERLMVVRVVMSWLRLMYAESNKTCLMGISARMDQVEHADKELTRAHTRYVRSIEALARVRKLVRIAEMADTQSRLMKERLTDQGKPAKQRLTLAEAKGA
jgi:hypothetical protein